MARQRLTRKEIKQPDQFISYTVRSLDWAKAHLHHILYGVLGILIIIGLAIAWSSWRQQRLQKAEVLLYQAVKLLNAEGQDTTSESGGKPEDRANREQARQQLLAITRDYSGSQVGALAQWHLGHVYYERAEYAKALAAYEEARRGIGQDNKRLIPSLVRLNIGYAQEASGDCARALSSYEEVVQSSASWLRGEAFLSMGRCYESTGALDDALAVYDRALADVDVSGAIRQSIEDRQTRLQAQMAGKAEADEKK